MSISNEDVDSWQKASGYYNDIINDYDKRAGGRNQERVKELAAEASAGLGLLELYNPLNYSPDYLRADDYYVRAIQLTNLLDREVLFNLHRVNIALKIPENQGCARADTSLKQANDLYGDFRKLNPNIILHDLEDFQQKMQSNWQEQCN